MATYGFSSLNKSLNSNDKGQLSTPKPDQITVGRVTKVYIDPNNPSQIGWVEYVNVNKPNTPPSDLSVSNTSILPIAKPILSHTRYIPLINEIILLITEADIGISSSISSKSVYYMSVINMWNHPHLNAFPQYEGNTSPTQQKSYVQTSLGSTVKQPNQPSTITLGDTFIELPNIHPLQPFEGDLIQEGRWGNSIRFGSTILLNGDPQNWWSSGSISGNPITIIRNGQGEQSNEGTTVVVEDINNDESSIWLASNQQIPLTPASDDYTSYKNAPTSPTEYLGKQIIINSGRLVFNTTEDHLLLSSNKSINLNGVESVNTDTPLFVVQADKIYLGSKNADQPLLLGNNTKDLLNSLLIDIKTLLTVLSAQPGVPPGTPLEPTRTTAENMIPSINQLISDINEPGYLTSKDNFTS
jgi:hypothetical protein